MLDVIEDNIVAHGTAKALMNIIDQLPATVNDAYERILSKSRDPGLARKILLIIIIAKEPLTVSEMNVALELTRQEECTSYEMLDRQPDNIFRSRVKQICGLFVSVHNNKVYLLHQTAREFLIWRPGYVSSGWQYSMISEQGESILFRICVRLLCFSDFGPPPWFPWIFYQIRKPHRLLEEIKPWIEGYTFFLYASSHWVEHYQMSAGSPENSLDLCLQLCNTSGMEFRSWWPIYRLRSPKPRRTKYFMTNDLVAACSAGLEAVAKRLLENGADANSADGHYGTPLYQASAEGWAAIVQLLMERGADTSVAELNGPMPLHVACHNGDQTVVRLLLNGGADANAIGLDETPLQAACSRGTEEIVQLLIEHGAEVNSTEGRYGTALQAACEARHENPATVKLLLESEADPTIDGRGPIHPALHLAAGSGKEITVQLLLDHGVNINSLGSSKWSGTALMVASLYGRDAMVDFLIARGANVHATSTHEVNAIVAAAGWAGGESTLQLLFSHGARFHKGDWEGLEGLSERKRKMLDDVYEEVKDIKQEEMIPILLKRVRF